MTSIERQRSYWTEWNVAKRARPLSEVSARQKREALRVLERLGRTDLDIIEIGCGAAWMTPWLKPFGHVTATDLSESVVAEAAGRIPDVAFAGGDFMQLPFADASFDVAVSFEVLAHVADQPAFVARIARLLRPGGYLILATQNAPVLERLNKVDPPTGQLRHWVDRHQLRALLEPAFAVESLISATPQANRGFWRLVNARALNAPIRAVLGDRVERLKERAWLGWTLMAVARKR